MDLRDTAVAEAFRGRVRAFVAAVTPPDWHGIGALPDDERAAFTKKVRAELAATGWLAPAWPEKYGGAGLSPAEIVVLTEELTRAGLPSGTGNDVFGITMLGNTMLRWADEDLCARFLPAIVSGEYVFSQGFSEPGAGSDLAGISVRAVLDGDRWTLHGQKLWSSDAHRANWMFVLARTDTEAAPHRGLTMLLVPLDQPGVEIRPIRNITGDTDFNETFFDGAVTDAGLVVGPVNGGWAVAMSLLGFERGELALRSPRMFRAELDRLVALARERGLDTDPDIRRRLAWCHVQVEQLRCHGLRTATRLVDGEEPGAEAASFKLLWSEYHRQATELAMDILGTDALAPEGSPSPHWYQTDDPGAPNSSASWVSVYLNARAGTIYAGTSQVQRNIVGELLLGLPKEPKAAPAEPRTGAATSGAAR